VRLDGERRNSRGPCVQRSRRLLLWEQVSQRGRRWKRQVHRSWNPCRDRRTLVCRKRHLQIPTSLVSKMILRITPRPPRPYFPAHRLVSGNWGAFSECKVRTQKSPAAPLPANRGHKLNLLAFIRLGTRARTQDCDVRPRLSMVVESRGRDHRSCARTQPP